MADKFAEITKIKSTRDELREEPQPIPFTEQLCSLQDNGAFPKLTPKMSTKEQLDNALSKLRNQYAPFLRNLAPAIPSYNQRIDITHFMRDGKEVTIPNYGGPLGYAFTEYTTEVEIGDFEGKAVYLHFDGADYIATVYLNGECVGIHEGFFSPFEFDVTRAAKVGKNQLRVVLQNDYAYMGSSLTADEAIITEGDKLYAATGLGYDDPEVGWHHCPPGMGIYAPVWIEIRNMVHLTDLYIRPLPESNEIEAWIEVENADHTYRSVEFEISLFGQNLEYTGFEKLKYAPLLAFAKEGDTEKHVVNRYEKDWDGLPLPVKFGKNVYKVRLKMENFKLWEQETPYLYQLQVTLLENGLAQDAKAQQFGMRTFTQDTESSPKGMFYLNGKKIRLRGANTMGFEQQDVMNGKLDQLIDDILLAKLCNMNYWRLTQRPVQDAVYEYCDKLGLLTQTDLPLFGVMRRNKVPEGVRQSEEMIRMVRKHPCNVVLTYINEALPNGYENIHRHLERDEMECFFTACDMMLKISCPECVIKHVEGDYDPPALDSMPDSHCYNLWYNNHGLEFRKLHKGYWQKVLKGWYYGCGEYGAEGLDFKEIMENDYPKDWIREPFSPKNIVKAQSDGMQHWFFDRPDSMDGWISATQEHQAFATRFMTEAFRRDPRMVSNAIHLFIDAWPSGWMKTIMDCKRNPKPAYFAYRNALEPVLVSLRSDRFTYYSGETAKIETYLCNDTNKPVSGMLHFGLYDGETLLQSGETPVTCGDCTAEYAVSACFSVPDTADRQKFTLKAALVDSEGSVISDNCWEFEAFADVTMDENDRIVWVTDLTPGTHTVAGETITVKKCDTRNYVSAQTGHPAVAEFHPNDFRFWYDKETDMLNIMTDQTFDAPGFLPILTAWDIPDGKDWCEQCVLAEKKYKGKTYLVSTIDLKCENPVAKRLLKNLYKL